MTRSLAILSVLALAVACQSCTGLSRVEAPVKEEPDRFVRVEARYPGGDKQGAARFEHPLVLSVREWNRILENVWVRHEPGVILVSPQEPPVPAFTADEIAFLSKWLAKAFKHVHPDEWVVFGLARPRSPDQLIEITTGGWFVENDRLNLRLTNYRHVVSMAQVRELLWDDPLHSSGDRYYALVPGDYQAATLVGGGPLGDLLKISDLQLTIDYKGLLKPPSVAKPAQKAEAPPPAAAPEEGLSSNTAQKLRELKQLRDEGTITEEEYRTKKRQLLERF